MNECMCWSLKVRRGDRDWGNHRREMSQLILRYWYSTVLRLHGREPHLWQSKSRLSLKLRQLLILPRSYLGQWVCTILLSRLFPLSFLEYENRKSKKSFVVYYSSAAAGCLAFETVPVAVHRFFGNYYKITKKRIRFFHYHNQFLIIDYNFRHRHWLALIDVVWMHSTQLVASQVGISDAGIYPGCWVSRMLRDCFLCISDKLRNQCFQTHFKLVCLFHFKTVFLCTPSMFPRTRAALKSQQSLTPCRGCWWEPYFDKLLILRDNHGKC